mmetsp:Transcript_3917/g.8743  ORF Transcript_3917/g.8743 Transcript_3917/m.8743 type:complete len:404 (-) Transcript_3917:306-1517(-)
MKITPGLKATTTLFLPSMVLMRPVVSLVVQPSAISPSLRRRISGSCPSLSSHLHHRSWATLPRVLYSTYRGDGQEELWYQPSLMDDMLYRIQEVNKVPSDVKKSLLDFVVDGKNIGKVTPKVAQRLCSIATQSSFIFELSQNIDASTKPILTLADDAGTTSESRTQAVASVMEHLRDNGYITGWRDEMYPVVETFDEVSNPVFLIERAASSLLGVLEYGVHINGIVLPENGNVMDRKNTKMWMARRSKTKSKFPGYLDHIVAGGQPAGLSLIENVVKECLEEAGIPPELTKKGIQPAGAISYESYGGKFKDDGEGVLSRVVLFCFDLILPNDFVPTAHDGEVDYFFQWEMRDIAKSMDPKYEDPIKPNCYPVIIDFLIRSGCISPDSPKYLDVLRTLRSGSCM